ALLIPWPASRAPPISTMGMALCMLILGTSLALALRGCNVCGSGFGFVEATSGTPILAEAYPLVFGATLLMAGGLAWASRSTPRLMGITTTAPKHRVGRWIYWTFPSIIL